MSEITAIEQQKKDKTRCSVYVDGRFYCGVKMEVAVKYRLKAGMQIEKSELDEIQLETEKSVALDRAMTHLSASMKTERQMRDFLTGKGYTPAVCDYVLQKLASYGYVDDVQYCKTYVGSVKGKGRRAVESELIKRGARSAAIEIALSDFEESADDAAEVLAKYLRGRVLTRENLAKGLRFLVSKGYNYDTARDAVAALGGGDEDN